MTTQNPAFRAHILIESALKVVAFCFLSFVIILMALEDAPAADGSLSHDNAAISAIDNDLSEGCHSIAENESFCVVRNGDVLTIELDGQTVHFAVDQSLSADASAMIERAAFQRIML